MTRRILSVLAVVLTGLLMVAPRALAQYTDPGTIDPGGGGVPDSPRKKDYEPEEPRARGYNDTSCPGIAVIADADRSTVFDGKGLDVTNIVYQTSLKPGTVSCKHKKGRQINIDVSAVIGAELGLAAESHEIEVPYFIAVIDPEDMVVTKLNETVRVVVGKGGRTAALPVESKTIKLVLEEDTRGNDLQVLVGLQLDKSQLDYNRTGH